jgi:hypothetical protein
MTLDYSTPRVVACLGAIMLLHSGGCAPRVNPNAPDIPPINRAPSKKSTQTSQLGRQLLVGEMCPSSVAGRPGVDAYLLHGVQWGNAPADLANAIERSGDADFGVWSYNGVRVGTFSSMGLAEIPGRDAVAAGGYTGSLPCAKTSTTAGVEQDPACVATMKGCGLALADIGPVGRGSDFVAGAACMRGTSLVVDIDGDGKSEWFNIGELLDDQRAPADEWLAQHDDPKAPACTATFATYNVNLAASSNGGGAPDPRFNVGFDVLGVLDLDGDGRREIIAAFRYADARTIAIYTARSMANRLELVAESRAVLR